MSKRFRYVVTWIAAWCVSAYLPGAHQIAAAQTHVRDVGVQVVVASLRELDSSDLGLSGRVGWRVVPKVGVEGELTWFPADLPSRHAVTARRIEALVGVTAGPSAGRLRPFARVRPGILHVAPAPRPIACVLIFPPPLSCVLASGRSMFVLDIGAGVEVDLTVRTFLRADVGSRLTRFPGPSFDAGRRAHAADFTSHDVRVALGAGWRF